MKRTRLTAETAIHGIEDAATRLSSFIVEQDEALHTRQQDISHVSETGKRFVSKCPGPVVRFARVGCTDIDAD